MCILVALPSIAGAAVATDDRRPDRELVADEIVHLLQVAGFLPEGAVSFEPVQQAQEQLQLGSVGVRLPADADGRSAVASTGVVVNGETSSGDFVVTTPSSFAVITDEHGAVEYRFEVTLPDESSIVSEPDGSLTNIDDRTGEVLGRLSPAFAIDESGQSHNASYAYDEHAGQLVMSADTTDAVGSTLIDPGRWRGWDCVWALASLGIGFFSGIVTSLSGWGAIFMFVYWQTASVAGAIAAGNACAD